MQSLSVRVIGERDFSKDEKEDLELAFKEGEEVEVEEEWVKKEEEGNDEDNDGEGKALS